MHITFIQPAVGRKTEGGRYPKTWIMEPLSLATLSVMTPSEWGRSFFDDRLGEVRYNIETDAVCISVECYTANRAYQIAERFRRRSIPVVMGGFHATLCPDEVALFADAVVCGEAEGVWADVLHDIKNHTLKKRYMEGERPRKPQTVNAARGDARPPNIRPPDRSIFEGRDYGPLNLVETSRGCRFQCEFCSITKFFKQTYTARPLDDVIAEIKTLPKSLLFFVDDNLAMDIERLKALCRALKPLRKRWLGQLSVHAAHDEALLALMAESGCAGVLIGFESLHAETLQDMGKQVNASHNDFRTAIANLRRHHISIYATFVFGYDHDTEESFEATYRFALENKFFFAAFNHLVPFPGTDVYERLRKEGRLLYEAWWRRDDVRFGDVVFRPKNFTPERLAELCQKYRLKFYSLPSILRRGNDYAANVRGLRKVLYFYIGNLTQEREVMRRKGLPFGGEP